ncbi:hypothetical protein GP486_000506 [Trichoglossum hirsutum]|uniref:Uncharacterized protein n=1 Tax=Trichoglossum hirsutum TaxID=265104 RepID=A0A9P8LIF5_9PEZI|nr:hypothetical protein GP486_000506 [Trichoglossum hirsutum]
MLGVGGASSQPDLRDESPDDDDDGRDEEVEVGGGDRVADPVAEAVATAGRAARSRSIISQMLDPMNKNKSPQVLAIEQMSKQAVDIHESYKTIELGEATATLAAVPAVIDSDRGVIEAEGRRYRHTMSQHREGPEERDDEEAREEIAEFLADILERDGSPVLVEALEIVVTTEAIANGKIEIDMMTVMIEITAIYSVANRGSAPPAVSVRSPAEMALPPTTSSLTGLVMSMTQLTESQVDTVNFISTISGEEVD